MAHSVEDEIRELHALFRSERDPEGHVFVPLADAYRRAGELDRAVELLTEGLASQSDFVPGHVVSGWVLRDQGDVVGAALAFRAALALDAKNTEALAGLAELDGKREPEASAVGEDKTPVTRTMADLYARQGLYGRALHVYQRLVERDPDDAALRERVRELQSLSGKIVGGAPDPEDVETLARDWAEGPGETGELSTPFAWAPSNDATPERPAGPSAREYFQGLLSWASGEPAHAATPVPASGAQSVSGAGTRAEPEASGAASVPVSASTPPADAAPSPVFAPDPVPVASTAPEVVSVAALAPDPDDGVLRERLSELESPGGMSAAAIGRDSPAGASAPEDPHGPLIWEFDEPTAEFAGPAAGAEARMESEVPDAVAGAPTDPVAPDTADAATSPPDPLPAADGQVPDGRTPED